MKNSLNHRVCTYMCLLSVDISGLLANVVDSCGLLLFDASFRSSSIIYLSIRHCGSPSSKSRGEWKHVQTVNSCFVLKNTLYVIKLLRSQPKVVSVPTDVHIWKKVFVFSFFPNENRNTGSTQLTCATIETLSQNEIEMCLCRLLRLSSREEYSQFLKEMIIQPGIAKANLGLSREDVTMEDHVSP